MILWKERLTSSKRVMEYSKSGVGVQKEQMAFTMDADLKITYT